VITQQERWQVTVDGIFINLLLSPLSGYKVEAGVFGMNKELGRVRRENH
jgi:hypothetical protein